MKKQVSKLPSPVYLKDLDYFDIPGSSTNVPLSNKMMANKDKDLSYHLKASPQLTSKTFTTNLKQDLMIDSKLDLASMIHKSPRISPNKLFKLTKPGRNRVALQSLSITRPLKELKEDDSAYLRRKLSMNSTDGKVTSGDETIMQNITEEDAIQQFYQLYRNIDKVSEINKFNQNQDSVFTSYLKKTEELKILPAKNGFVIKKSDSKSRLNIK